MKLQTTQPTAFNASTNHPRNRVSWYTNQRINSTKQSFVVHKSTNQLHETEFRGTQINQSTPRNRVSWYTNQRINSTKQSFVVHKSTNQLHETELRGTQINQS